MLLLLLVSLISSSLIIFTHTRSLYATSHEVDQQLVLTPPVSSIKLPSVPESKYIDPNLLNVDGPTRVIIIASDSLPLHEVAEYMITSRVTPFFEGCHVILGVVKADKVDQLAANPLVLAIYKDRKIEYAVSTDSSTADLAKKALAVLAVGTCSSFGGIPSGKPNPTGAKSVMEFLKEQKIDKPVINIPGCPPHPDWIVGTIADILINGLPTADKLDEVLRPKAFYGELIHDNCPRRAFFDAGQFARNTGELAAFMRSGARGPTHMPIVPTVSGTTVPTGVSVRERSVSGVSNPIFKISSHPCSRSSVRMISNGSRLKLVNHDGGLPWQPRLKSIL